jgi:small acid-soluble spore protein F (minor alpha/beta-type SASP)
VYQILHKKLFAEDTKREGVRAMKAKRELTKQEKKDMTMKYEIAEELGLLDKVRESGWRGLTSRESGRIGGLMGRRKAEARAREKACNPNAGKI